MSGKLTQAKKKQLQAWIGTGPKSIELLYSFTRDGSTPAAFHSKCDNQGPTITVLYDTQNSVYGGYTEVSWQSTTGTYSSDSKAFLFSLQLSGTSTCEQYPQAKNPANAVHSNATYGPTFGGGHDMYNFSSDLTASSGVYTLAGTFSFGHTYGMKSRTAADFTNTVTELEVYKVTVSEAMDTVAWRTRPDWNHEYLDFLKSEIQGFTPPQEVKLRHANILLIGPVGAGKSSFFNTVSSVFRGHVTRQACCGSAEKSITSKFRVYKVRGSSSQKPLMFRICDTRGLQSRLLQIYQFRVYKVRGSSSQKPLMFRICDTRGLEESESIDSQDLGYVLDGNLPDGYQFNPASPVSPDTPGFKRAPSLNDRIHCVCFVIDGSTAGVLPEKMVEGIKSIQKRIHQKEIPQMMLLTKVDKVCEQTESDLSLVFKSSVVRELVESVSQIFGLPRNQILPYKSYEKETELAESVSILALTSLRQMLSAAEDYMYNYIDEALEKGSDHDV